jgi:flagellar protein FliO/FliZ
MIRLYIALSIFLPTHAFALEDKVGPPDLALTSMLGSLLLVIVCIFIFAFLMKQTNLLKNARGKSQIKIIATQPLSTKSRVQMIEVNGQQYLLGVTEQNVTLLDKLDKPLTVDCDIQKQDTVTPFSVLLSKISKKSND